jgi:hypothetical protein
MNVEKPTIIGNEDAREVIRRAVKQGDLTAIVHGNLYRLGVLDKYIAFRADSKIGLPYGQVERTHHSGSKVISEGWFGTNHGPTDTEVARK